MSISVVFAIAGVIALLFGIVGGGIKAKEIEVPILPVNVRIATIIIGIILIGFTFWLEMNNKAQTAQVSEPSQNTSLESPEELAPKILSDARNWESIASTDFSSNKWLKESFDDESWKGNEKITSDGTYLVTLNNVSDSPDDGFWIMPILEQVSDFYLSVEAKFVAGRSNNSYGLVFRSNGFDAPAYVFRIFGQSYDIQIFDGDWKELSGTTPSPYLLPDAFNRLTVIGQGSEFYFYINDNFVHHVTDSQIRRGNVGIRISAHEGIEQIIEFDNFELRIPK
jgi:hypothetical protein